MSLALAIVGLVLMVMGISGFYSPEGMVKAQERYPIGPTDAIDSEMRYHVTRFAALVVTGIGMLLVAIAYFR
ncbi:hypothetical protein [Natranaeroarchaeum sulfidigenes]|uniref:DUF1772 domain-containing protein n=1 Tax=Natranaeroarchaeum sulfidigenes TaxID=2784880 RepID=A0A897MV75_9EURY|nr:hypothetical protein [Natranaeroarchaeum sulfidigenes]QSG02145.1 hypothetical protein AArcS_0923 [Natranaeroarchaeum sulfidigenes]